MSDIDQGKCSRCGAPVFYHIGDTLVKCEYCNQLNKVVEFESELARIHKIKEDHKLVKQKLKIAEQEKKAANDRLFDALSDLNSLKGKQRDIRDLLKALKEDTANGNDTISNIFKALVSGQKSVDGKLELLQNLSNDLLKSQEDVNVRLQTQNEIIDRLNELKMNDKRRQQLQNDFREWIKDVKDKDLEKLKQISDSSRLILNEQKKLADKVEELNHQNKGIDEKITDFRQRWEEDKLNRLHELYHMANGYYFDRQYDKAEECYRKLIINGGKDGEVYWRLLLCHYCIFYQEDENKRQIPIILNPDLSDPNEMSLRRDLRTYLPEEQFPSYYESLREIDQILDKYRLLKNEVKYDIFISVKQKTDDGEPTRDREIGIKLYEELKKDNYSVFNSEITKPPAGEQYEPYIIAALISAKVLIVVGSSTENMSAPWVKNEWSRFLWMMRREKAKRGKAERKLICYLTDGMQPKQLPRGLSASYQAIIDSNRAMTELSASLAFLRKTEEPVKNTFFKRQQENDQSVSFQKIEKQMTVWLITKQFDKVIDQYNKLTDKWLYMDHASLYIMTLCAKNRVTEIESIVLSQSVLEEMDLVKAALAVCHAPEERKKINDLIALNRDWRKEYEKKREPESDKKTVEEWYQAGLKAYSDKNYTEAVKWYHEAAVQGHIAAQFYYAFSLELGQGIDKNEIEAAKWYRKAAEAGDADSQNKLGLFYALGKGVSADDQKAFYWFKKAALNGQRSGQYNYALFLSEGRGTEQNETEGYVWYRKAAEAGHLMAQNELGNCYENGIGVAKDLTEAKKWYQKAAAQGQEDAKKNLERLLAAEKKQEENQQKQAEVWYQDGERARNEQDYANAAKWYRKAAEAEHAEAQNMLGWCYDTGTGVPINHEEAVKWFYKAALLGHIVAQYNYGQLLRVGRGIDKNEIEAAMWYRKAAEGGYADAQNQLGWCYSSGTGVTENQEEAFKWFKKAALQGLAIGEFNYALDLEVGRGTEKDEIEAAMWYRKAAEEGYADAQNSLGRCYETGIGISIDLEEAKKWYQMAADQGQENAKKNLERLLSAEKEQEAARQESPEVWYQHGRTEKEKNSFTEAVKWFRKAAEAGHAKAQGELGLCYSTGTGVEKDETEAVKWFKESARQGVLMSQINYARRLVNGIGTAKNEAEGFRWYQKAAETGNSYAQNGVGTCYEFGYGVSQNFQEAKNWYQKAADQGNNIAKKNLDRIIAKITENEKAASGNPDEWYRLGDQAKARKDYAEAVKWWQKAAQAGHSDAQTMLGWCYDTGNGTAVDKAQAARWNKEAALQGNKYAQYNYGLCLEFGKGIRKNEIEAAIWYQKSADQGFADAQFAIGKCFFQGIGVLKNNAEAKKWFQKAAAQGNENAKSHLEIIRKLEKEDISSAQQAQEWYFQAKKLGPSQKKEAAQLYKLAAEKGHTESQYEYAKILLFGDKTLKNETEGIKWCRKAAEAGYAPAQDTLGSFLVSTGINSNMIEGISWLQKAAAAGEVNAQLGLGMAYESGQGVNADKEEAIKWYQKAASQKGWIARLAQKRLKKLTKKGFFS